MADDARTLRVLRPCGCWVMMAVLDGHEEHQKEYAQDAVETLAAIPGATMDTVPVSVARQTPFECEKCRKPEQAAQEVLPL